MKRSGTYTRLYIQMIFAVEQRRSLISTKWEEELYKYMTGIITNKDQKLLAINGAYDHIHIFIGMKPTCCISDLVREVKKSSTNFINERFLNNFNWQDGYGAFSYSHSSLDSVIKYIQNQKEHHKKRTFKEEYIDFLEKFEIEYQEEYLFDWIDDLKII